MIGKRPITAQKQGSGPKVHRSNQTSTSDAGNKQFLGGKTFKICLSQHDLVSESDSKETEMAQFVAMVACSLHNYKSKESMAPVCEIDLERLKDKTAIELATSYFESGVRYVQLTDSKTPVLHTRRSIDCKLYDPIKGVALTIAHCTEPGNQTFFRPKSALFDAWPFILHDRGTMHYIELYMDMNIRTFRGHFKSMPGNGHLLVAGNTNAMMKIHSMLEATPNAFTDSTIVKVALDSTLAPHAFQGPSSHDGTTTTSKDQPASESVDSRTIITGNKTYRMRLCDYSIRNTPRSHDHDVPILDPLVEFVLRAALSIYNRHSRITSNIYPINDHLDMSSTLETIKRIDLRMFTSSAVLHQAPHLLGSSSYRFVEFIDSIAPTCDVGYSVSEGTLCAVKIFCKNDFASELTQSPFVLTLDELWDVRSKMEADTQNAINNGCGGGDRSNPEYYMVNFVLRNRFADLKRRSDSAIYIAKLQQFVEEEKAVLFKTFASKRKDGQRPFATVSGWEQLTTLCVTNLSSPTMVDILVFMWHYEVYITTDTKWSDKGGRSMALIASHITKLTRWLRIELEWLFGTNPEMMRASLKKVVPSSVCNADDSSTDDDDEMDVDAAKTTTPTTPTVTVVDVLIGGRNKGKTRFCGEVGAKETLSLFEYTNFKKRFPHKNAYLVLSCDSVQFSNVRSILEAQEFAPGDFEFMIHYKRTFDTPPKYECSCKLLFQNVATIPF